MYSLKQTTALLDLLTTLPTGYFSVLLLNVKITILYSEVNPALIYIYIYIVRFLGVVGLSANRIL